MGFGGREIHGSFDRMFDLDRNGHLDSMEQAMQYEFLEESMKDEDEEDDEEFSDDDFDETDDI